MVVGFTVLILGSLLFSVGLDVRINDNNFEKSFTGQKLKEYGGYEYGLLAYEQTVLATNKTAQWAIENVPIYLNSSSEYLALGKDLSKIAFNVGKRITYNVTQYFSENYPVAEYWYAYYFGFCFLPGPLAGIVQGHSLIAHMKSIMPDTKVQKNIPVVRDSIYSAVSATKEGATVAVEAAKEHGLNAAVYLRTNVFVGKLSPENLQKSAKSAYDTTQGYASSTYSWVYEKVQTLSKSQG